MDVLSAPVFTPTSSTTVTRDLCDAMRCGAYPDYSAVPGGVATAVACSQQYGASALGMCDSTCRPHWDLIRQNNPSLNPGSQCNPHPAAAAVAAPAPVTLTVENIVQPIPDITRALAPVPAPEARCSLWCDLNAAIADHPVAAVVVLLGAAVLALGGRRRG